MLREEMKNIDKVYNAKDEQLKTILELLSTQFKAQHENSLHEVETISNNTKIDNVQPIIELKEYLKTLDLESYQRKVIKKRFLAVYNEDIRVIKQNGKIYLDFSKYDYSDLLKY